MESGEKVDGSLVRFRESGPDGIRWHNLHTMARGIWVGTIEISYLDHEDSDKRKNAFTVVTTWASSAEEFRRKSELMLDSYGWKLPDIDRANPAPGNYDYNYEVADQLERTRVNPNAIIYGTFYTYPVM